MAKDIIINVDINDNLDKVDQSIKKITESGKTMKQQLKDLQNEMNNLPTAGAAFEKVARAAGELKDKIGESQKAVNTFSSDTRKLDLVVGSVQGLAGAFATVQGSIGLLSGENKELEKTLLKVQSSLAVLNGIQQVANTLNKESAVGSALYATANKILSFSFKEAAVSAGVFKTALVATGVGAFVVLIGVLVANFDKLKAAVSGYSDAQKEANELAITGLTRQIALQKALGEETYTAQIELLNQQILKLKMADASAEEISKAKLERDTFLNEHIQANFVKTQKAEEDANKQSDADNKRVNQMRINNMSDGLNKELAMQKENFKETEAWMIKYGYNARQIEEQNQIERNKIISKYAKEASDKKKANQDQEDKAWSAEQDAFIKDFLDGQEKIKKEADDKEANRIKINSQTRIDLITDQNQKEIQIYEEKRAFDREAAVAAGADMIEFDKATNLQITDIVKTQEDKKNQIIKESNEKQLVEAKKLADKKKAINEFYAQSALESLSVISQFVDLYGKKNEASAKKAFEINKQVQTAETIINTFMAAQKAYASQILPGDPTSVVRAQIAAGLAIAGGLARVAKIQSTTYQNASGGGNNPTNVGDNGGSFAPSNPFQNNQSFGPSIQPQTIITSGTGQRVYVLESDISTVVNRVKVIENGSNIH